MFDIPWRSCTPVQAPSIVNTRSISRSLSITLTSVRSVGLFSDGRLVLGLEAFHPKTKSAAWGLLPHRDRYYKVSQPFSFLLLPSSLQIQQPHKFPWSEQVPQGAFRVVRSVGIRLTVAGLKSLTVRLYSRAISTPTDTPCSPVLVRIYLASPPSGTCIWTFEDRFFGFFSDATADPSVDHSFPHFAGRVQKFAITSRVASKRRNGPLHEISIARQIGIASSTTSAPPSRLLASPSFPLPPPFDRRRPWESTFKTEALASLRACPGLSEARASTDASLCLLAYKY